MTTLFETKEQYFYFRKMWADAVNSPKSKSTVIQGNYGAYREAGWLKAEHMMLCNILRQRSFDRGFSPVTSKNKLENGAHINAGLYFACNELRDSVVRAKKIMIANESGGLFKKKETPNEWDVKYVTKFLAPFNETVSVEMLSKVELPEVQLLESAYGKGRKIARQILESETKPTSFAQIDEMLKEVA